MALAVTVHLDASAGLALTLETPAQGATVWWVKEELCRQDPTGALCPEGICLCSLRDLGVIDVPDDAAPITSELTNLAVLPPSEECEQGAQQEPEQAFAQDGGEDEPQPKAGPGAREESVAEVSGQVLRVVGGEGRGGIVVRTGPTATSHKAPARLSTGALIQDDIMVDEGAKMTPARGGAVYAISDIHCETKENMKWVETLPEHPEDTLIVAGDLAVDLAQLERALRLLQEKYRHVFYCWGNHECWVSKHQTAKGGFADSLGKIAALRELCESLGVKTRAQLVGGAWIVPIFGWYHSSWDREPGLTPPPGQRLRVEPRDPEDISTDYLTCRWGSGHEELANGSEELARRLDEENEAWGAWPLPQALLDEAREAPGRRQRPIISFSHFLPRPELCWEKRFLPHPNLHKLIGSDWIRERVDGLRPDIHIFGHTHHSWDMCLDGVRYRSWPLGMPDERPRNVLHYPKVEELVKMNPLLILDEAGRQTPPMSFGQGLGSDLYKIIDRDPSSSVMASRVAGKFCPGAPALFRELNPGAVYPWEPVEDAESRECRMNAAQQVIKHQRNLRVDHEEWEVVGGADRGGIIVREGEEIASAKLPDRLATGALVEQLALNGDRLYYRKLRGEGPKTGWVGIALPGKELLVRLAAPPKKGDLSLDQILALQDALIKRLQRPELQSALGDLCRRHPGKERYLAPFAQRRWDLLQAEYDQVLPAYGFQKFPNGNLTQLNDLLTPFLNVVTGNDMVKRKKCLIDQLSMLQVDIADLKKIAVKDVGIADLQADITPVPSWLSGLDYYFADEESEQNQ